MHKKTKLLQMSREFYDKAYNLSYEYHTDYIIMSWMLLFEWGRELLEEITELPQQRNKE